MGISRVFIYLTWRYYSKKGVKSMLTLSRAKPDSAWNSGELYVTTYLYNEVLYS